MTQCGKFVQWTAAVVAVKQMDKSEHISAVYTHYESDKEYFSWIRSGDYA